MTQRVEQQMLRGGRRQAGGSVDTAAQLGNMFADIGWSRGEQNPPPPPEPSLSQALMAGKGGGNPMGAGMGGASMAQGGYVDVPGYYQQGGTSQPSLGRQWIDDLERQKRIFDENVRQWRQQIQPQPQLQQPVPLPRPDPRDERLHDYWLRNRPLNRPAPDDDGTDNNGTVQRFPLPLSRNIEDRRGVDPTMPPPMQSTPPIPYRPPSDYQRGGEVPYTEGSRRFGRLPAITPPLPNWQTPQPLPIGDPERIGQWVPRWADSLRFTRDTGTVGALAGGYQRGGAAPALGIPAMNTMASQAHYGAMNMRPAIGRPPGIHLMSSPSIPGRTDRIPMRARAGSYVLPADVVSGLGQGNTHAGARMWGQAIMAAAGPAGAGTMGMRRASIPRPPSMPGLTRPTRVPSPNRALGFADGGGDGGVGGDEYVPIITAGGEVLIDPEIVEALGNGSEMLGKRKLAESVLHVRKQVIEHLKKLPRPVA